MPYWMQAKQVIAVTSFSCTGISGADNVADPV